MLQLFVCLMNLLLKRNKTTDEISKTPGWQTWVTNGEKAPSLAFVYCCCSWIVFLASVASVGP